MDKMLYDIEVFPNYFCVGLKDYVTKKIIFYEISEERNDLHQIYEYFTKYSGFLISFNGIHYDNMIMKYLILNYDKYKSYYYGNICFDLKWFSDKIINDDYNDNLVKQIKYKKVPWTDIDLFLYWSKGLRISKKISLKSLGIQLGYPVVQELPFKPDTVLRLEDLDKVRVYNYTHDLGILDLLTSKMEPDIELRGYILKEYGLKCWSYDAPKIASEYLLEYTCRKTYSNKSIPYWEYKKNIRNNRYETSPWKIGDYLPKVKFKTKFFQDIYEDFCNTRSDNQSIKDILFEQKSGENIILSVSSGGLHTVNNNQKFSETDEYYLRDADIASLYPTLFRKHKFLRKELQVVLDKYLEVIDDRIEAKRSGDKRKDTFLKLILNSFSGLVDSNVTWMYSPQEILALRVFGQLIQLRFIEELNEVGITTIFSNTDGTLAKVPKHLSDKYNEIALNIAKEFEVTWEFCDLELINFSNTNTYISKINKEFMLDENLNEINVKEKVKIKRKGKFFRLYEDIPLGDATDCLIINKALQAFYLDDMQPEEYISNPEKYNHHIYDYCKSNKISKNFDVYYNGVLQQNLNRYYFSKNKPYLFKQKDGIGTMQHVNVGQGVTLYNNHKELKWEEYDINYSYYISQTKKIINEINNNNQLKLFT